MKKLFALVAVTCFLSYGAFAQSETSKEEAPKVEQAKSEAEAATDKAADVKAKAPEGKKKACCAGKTKSSCKDAKGKASASAGEGKGSMKACCAAKAKEGKACCAKKAGKAELKAHVCTDACTKDQHAYACGEEGHVCTEECKSAEL